jgi:putative ABC transport system permease protein
VTGRWRAVAPLDESDVRASAKVALVGQTVAQMLFGGTDPTGQTIRVKYVPFTIVGLLEAKGQSYMGQDQDDVVLIPINTARGRILGQAQGRLRSVGHINLKMTDGVDMKRSRDSGARTVAPTASPATRPGRRFQHSQSVRSRQSRAGRFDVLSGLLAAVASVSLLVGGIGIMNIMLVSVTERTREIGIRMAVGARRNDILVQFLAEAVILSLLGALIGIALGIGGALGLGHFAGWQVVLQPAATLLAVIFAAGIGTFFGWYPARKAARLSPIDALRYE